MSGTTLANADEHGYMRGMREHEPALCWWVFVKDGQEVACILDRGHDNGKHETAGPTAEEQEQADYEYIFGARIHRGDYDDKRAGDLPLDLMREWFGFGFRQGRAFAEAQRNSRDAR